MKKFILLATLVFGMNVFAQEAFVGVAVDVRNAAIGSEPTGNQPAFDGLFKVGMVGAKNFELQAQYETFKEIGFTKEAVGFGYKIPLSEELSVTPLVEPTLIHRKWKESDNAGYDKTNHLGAGFSLSTRYKLGDRLGVEIHTNYLFRGDNDWRYGANAEPWVLSVYGGLTYRIGG